MVDMEKLKAQLSKDNQSPSTASALKAELAPVPHTKEDLTNAIKDVIKMAEALTPRDDSITQCLGKLIGAERKLQSTGEESPKLNNPFKRRR